jgi:hypothetical protein
MRVQFEERLRKVGDSRLWLAGKGEAAYRSDGSWAEVRESRSVEGRLMYTQRWITLKPGVSAHVYEDMRVYVPAHPMRYNGERMDPASGCTQTRQGIVSYQRAGSATYLGYETLHLRQVGGSAQGPKSEVWQIPSLDCPQVRRYAEFRGKDGAVDNSSEWIATAILMEEPGDELFRIPADYQVQKPSEAMVMHVKRVGGSEKDQEDARRAFLDSDKFFEQRSVDMRAFVQ